MSPLTFSPPNLKLLANACLIQNLIGRVARFELSVNGEISPGNRAEPDLVIVFALAAEGTAVLDKDFPHILFKGRH
ncbi:MAG: hypothetical protein ACLPWS_18810 [Rhodomicrobium sp.]